MSDIVNSMSVIRNFMANASRTTCNEYLFTALQDALICMDYRNCEDLVVDECPDHVHYKCPCCGKIHRTTYENQSVGHISNFCDRCGKALK